MTHLYTIHNNNLNRWYATCSCGWVSLTYNNETAANTAGQFHVGDEA